MTDHEMDDLVLRSIEERRMPLSDFIRAEGLERYELGYEDILYVDSLNNAVLPCREYMILVRERADDDNGVAAEYAVYSQEDRDNRPLVNSLNMNAVYHLEFVDTQIYSNMAEAVANAYRTIMKEE